YQNHVLSSDVYVDEQRGLAVLHGLQEAGSLGYHAIVQDTAQASTINNGNPFQKTDQWIRSELLPMPALTTCPAPEIAGPNCPANEGMAFADTQPAPLVLFPKKADGTF